MTVTLADVVAPELITCIKFIPQPGRHYVIGAWAREQPVEAEPAGTSSFDEVKEIITLPKYNAAAENHEDIKYVKLNPKVEKQLYMYIYHLATMYRQEVPFRKYGS